VQTLWHLPLSIISASLHLPSRTDIVPAHGSMAAWQPGSPLCLLQGRSRGRCRCRRPFWAQLCQCQCIEPRARGGPAMLLSGAVARVLGKCLYSWTPGAMPIGEAAFVSSEHANEQFFHASLLPTRPPPPLPPSVKSSRGCISTVLGKVIGSDGTRRKRRSIGHGGAGGPRLTLTGRGASVAGATEYRWLVRHSSSHLIPKYSFTVLYSVCIIELQKVPATCILLRQSWVCTAQEDGILDRSQDSHVHCIGQFRGPSHPIPSPQFTRCA
jgi:uncharacterized protein YodC (DUF2158 family)